jgi:hypothetical protein
MSARPSLVFVFFVCFLFLPYCRWRSCRTASRAPTRPPPQRPPTIRSLAVVAAREETAAEAGRATCCVCVPSTSSASRRWHASASACGQGVLPGPRTDSCRHPRRTAAAPLASRPGCPSARAERSCVLFVRCVFCMFLYRLTSATRAPQHALNVGAHGPARGAPEPAAHPAGRRGGAERAGAADGGAAGELEAASRVRAPSWACRTGRQHARQLRTRRGPQGPSRVARGNRRSRGQRALTP